MDSRASKIAFIDATRPGGTGEQCARYLLELCGFDTIVLAAALADQFDTFRNPNDPRPQPNRDVLEVQRTLTSLPACAAPGSRSTVLVLPYPAGFTHGVLGDDVAESLLADLTRLGIDHIDAAVFNASGPSLNPGETFARRRAFFYPRPRPNSLASPRHPMQHNLVAHDVSDVVADNCARQMALLGPSVLSNGGAEAPRSRNAHADQVAFRSFDRISRPAQCHRSCGRVRIAVVEPGPLMYAGSRSLQLTMPVPNAASQAMLGAQKTRQAHSLTAPATIVKRLAASLDVFDVQVNAASLGGTPAHTCPR